MVQIKNHESGEYSVGVCVNNTVRWIYSGRDHDYIIDVAPVLRDAINEAVKDASVTRIHPHIYPLGVKLCLHRFEVVVPCRLTGKGTANGSARSLEIELKGGTTIYVGFDDLWLDDHQYSEEQIKSELERLRLEICING